MMKKKLFSLFVCMFLITLVIPLSAQSCRADIENNEVVEYCTSSPYDVIILNVLMADHNIKCKGLGGQTVDMGVEIRYQSDRNLIEPFTISLFLDQFDYIEHQYITKDMILEGKNRVIFPDIYLGTKIGKHTLDAYVDYDVRTRNYLEFYTTLIGFRTSIRPFWKWILDHRY